MTKDITVHVTCSQYIITTKAAGTRTYISGFLKVPRTKVSCRFSFFTIFSALCNAAQKRPETAHLMHKLDKDNNARKLLSVHKGR